MEAVLMATPHTAEQSLANSSNKILQIRIKNNNSKRNSGGRGGNFKSYPSPSHHHDSSSSYAGLLNPPLPRAMSLSQPLFTTHHQQQQQQQHRQNHQPPLLPLPTVSSAIHHQPLLSRSLSSSQALSSRKDRGRDMSLTPKKSKPTKREDSAKKRSSSAAATMVVASDNHCWGPDPKDLPKHIPLVLTLRGKGIDTVSGEPVVMDDMFSSGSVLSPPPSSLPLPKFSLMRSKLISCNAEAAGVDDGATNNLRRLLRLR